MITEGLLDVLNALWSALLWCIPTPPPMDWIHEPVIMTVAEDIGAMGSWLPLVSIAMVGAALFAAWLAAGGVVIVRMLVSLFTGGGGNVSAR